MGKADTNRTNLKYATDLKRRGFATAIHALPKEAQDHVDQLLSKGWKGHRIANEINQRYGELIPRLGLKPISFSSINTYRDKYWKKTPAFSNLILKGDEKTKKEIEQAHEDLNLYKDMIANKKRIDELANKSYEFTKNSPLPAESTVSLVERCFKVNKELLHEQFALGLVEKNPSSQSQNTGVVQSISDDIPPRIAKMTEEELFNQINKAMRALQQVGEYAQPTKFIGEDLSGLS